MNETLKKRLLQAGAAGSIGIAGVLVNWHEGRVYTAYRDPVGIVTVCEGITGPDVVVGKRYSDAECNILRDKHLAIAAAGVDRAVKVSLNDWQRAALIDFTFNAGAGNLESSTMVKKFNVGDYAGGCTELYRWTKGRVSGQLVSLPGLVKRRADEADLCLNWGKK